MSFNPSLFFAVLACGFFFAVSFCIFSLVFILRILHRMAENKKVKTYFAVKKKLLEHLLTGDPIPDFNPQERTLALALIDEFSLHIDSDCFAPLRQHLKPTPEVKYVGTLQTIASYSAGQL